MKLLILLLIVSCLPLVSEGEEGIQIENNVVWVDTEGYTRGIGNTEGSVRKITKNGDKITLREWVGTKSPEETNTITFPIKDWGLIKRGIECALNLYIPTEDDYIKSLEARIEKLEEADEKVITVPDYSNCPYHGE